MSTDSPAEKDKDWVDVKKEADNKSEEDKKKMLKEEEEFLQTLRYNVNVFLPHMKSIESLDAEAHKQLQKDEEEARKLAGYLWNTVLPDVTKKLRLGNGETFQIPVDGKSLTELIHNPQTRYQLQIFGQTRRIGSIRGTKGH